MPGAADDDERRIQCLFANRDAKSREAVQRELTESFEPERNFAGAVLKTLADGANHHRIRPRAPERQKVAAVFSQFRRVYVPQGNAFEPAAWDECRRAFNIPGQAQLFRENICGAGWE